MADDNINLDDLGSNSDYDDALDDLISSGDAEGSDSSGGRESAPPPVADDSPFSIDDEASSGGMKLSIPPRDVGRFDEDQNPPEPGDAPQEAVSAQSRDETPHDGGGDEAAAFEDEAADAATDQFAPVAPTVPEAGSASPANPFDQFGDDDDDEIVPAESDKGLLGKIAGWSTKTKALAATGLVGAVGVAGVAAASGGGGGEKDAPQGPNEVVVADQPASNPNPAGGGAPDGSASDNLIGEITAMEASCPRGANDQRLAVSTDESEAWICPRQDGLDGQILNIQFKKPVELESVSFTPGFDHVSDDGKDEWNHYRVVSSALWRAGGKEFHQDVTPARQTATFKFDEPVTADRMSLTIQHSVDPSDTVGGGDDSDDPFEQAGAGGGQVEDATAIQNLVISGQVK